VFLDSWIKYAGARRKPFDNSSIDVSNGIVLSGCKETRRKLEKVVASKVVCPHLTQTYVVVVKSSLSKYRKITYAHSP
jgi:hypothetical protein